MLQDEADAKQGVAPMQLDNVEPEEDWKSTGAVLTGKGPQGEETLYLLQQRGSMTRVVPKGGKRGTKGGGKGGKGEMQVERMGPNGTQKAVQDAAGLGIGPGNVKL